VATQCDAVILMDQVPAPGTGVVTADVLKELAHLDTKKPVIADSRTGLRGFPPCIFKMNAGELAAVAGLPSSASESALATAAGDLARRNQRPVFVTLAGQGILAADAGGAPLQIHALPVRGPLDIVGAGDAVTANLAAALASGAEMREAMELAMLAASEVVHQLGTSGAATVAQLAALLAFAR
jgi:bifunctional ADP-heptose synthase (sugar kinase/adenylyltransferase)